MEADEVLAGLDPEQREVAEADPGPGVRARRRRHRQDPGDHPPDRVRACHRRGRPAAGARRHVHHPRGRRAARPAAAARRAAGVQARTFHAAALRQLQLLLAAGRRRRAAPAARVQGSAWSREAAARLPAVRSAATELRDLARRDRVGQGHPDRARRTTPRAAAKAGRTPPLDAGRHGAGVYAAYEELKRDRDLLDFEDMLLLTARDPRPSTRRSRPQVRDQYRHFVVDEYQDVNPLQQRLLDAWLGDRDDLCVVGDPHQTIYSFTGASPAYLLGFTAEYPGRDGRQAGPRLPLDAAGGAPRQRRAGAGAGGEARPARLELVAQRPRRPASRRFDEYDDEAAEAAAVAAPGPRADRRRACRRARSPCCSGSTPSPSRTSRRWPTPGCPTWCAAASGSSTAPRCAQAVVLLRGAARRSRRRRRPLGPASAARTSWPASGLTDRAAGRPRRGPRALGVAGRAGPARRGRCRRRPRREPRRVRRRAGPSAPRRSTPRRVEGVTLASLHAAKGLEWDAVFLVGLAEGTLPIIYAETRRADRGGAPAALRRGDPGPASTCTLSWALARARRAAARAARRPGSSTAWRRRAPGRPRDRPERRRAGQGPQPCRVCGRPLTAASSASSAAARLPGPTRRGTAASAKEWRASAARSRRSRPSSCSPTRRCRRSPNARPVLAELAAIPGVGAASSTTTAPRSSRCAADGRGR